MSGRLIILPKKSWHPGKRENIEKVLRDERLAAEEAAAARNRAREIAQEGIVETLTKRRSAAEQIKSEESPATETPVAHKRRRRGQDKHEEPLGGKGQGWGATLQHVNLFSDAEREAGKLLGQNAEHQREKKEQDLKKLQRSGLAPTALGEGSAELKDRDSQPWYSQSKFSSSVPTLAARTVRLGREVTGQEAEEAIKRDQGRKGRADPMGSLFRSGTQRTGETSPPGKMRVTPGSGEPSLNLLGGTRAQVGVTAARTGEHDHDGRNRFKKDKKDKKRKKHKRRSKERRRDTNGSRGGSPAVDDVRGPSLEELRSRRLAREGGERERQTRLLAEREMAGQSLPDERRMAYNNQYNAPAARQNRSK